MVDFGVQAIGREAADGPGPEQRGVVWTGRSSGGKRSAGCVVPGPFAIRTIGAAALPKAVGRHSRTVVAGGDAPSHKAVVATPDSPIVDRGDHEKNEPTLQI